MALVKKAASGLILANEASKSFTGKNDKDLADAIANGLVTYSISTPNLILFTLSGTVGPVGQVTSVSVAPIVPSVMATLMYSKALSLQLKGKNILQLFQAISNGVASHFSTMQVTGSTAGLAVGVGTGRFTNMIEAPVSNLVYANFLSKIIKGKNARQLAQCVGFGFVSHMKQSPTVIATVTGAIAPVSPAGPIATAGIPTVFNKIA